MSIPKREKVAVIFLNELDLDELSVKFLVLHLNKMQECFEFEFPETLEYPLGKMNYTDASSAIIDFSKIIKDRRIDGDYSIGLVSGSI